MILKTSSRTYSPAQQNHHIGLSGACTAPLYGAPGLTELNTSTMRSCQAGSGPHGQQGLLRGKVPILLHGAQASESLISPQLSWKHSKQLQSQTSFRLKRLWCTPVMPAFERQEQENNESEAGLSYTKDLINTLKKYSKSALSWLSPLGANPQANL